MKNIFKCCHTSRLLVFWKKIHLLYKSRLSPRKNHPHIWHVVKCCCSDSKIEFSDCQYFSARNNFLIKFNFFDFFRSKPKLTKNGSLQAFGRLCLPRHIHSRCPGWDHHSLKSKLQDHSLTSKLQDHHLNYERNPERIYWHQLFRCHEVPQRHQWRLEQGNRPGSWLSRWVEMLQMLQTRHPLKIPPSPVS